MPIISCLATLRIRAATRIFARAAFSPRVSLPLREILSRRQQPVHRAYISLARYARDIEISLHGKFERGVYAVAPAEVPPRIVKPFPCDAESRASALGKRLRSLNGYVGTLYLTERVLRDIYLIFPSVKKVDLKRPATLYCHVVVISTS